MIDATTALSFSMYENRGVYALLLGSGVSRAAQIPTGWEITLDLVRRVAGLAGVPDQLDWAKWHHDQFGKEPSYSELLDQLSTTPDERRSILHNYIEPTADDVAEGRKVPTKAHHAIARLVQAGFIRVIITTNFDRLLENALRDAGVEPTVIKSDDDLKGAVPLIHSRCFIIKIHGDYLDTRIRNTETELSAYSAEMNTLLDRIFDEHGLVICGWSADWDPALKSAITRASNRRYPLFWATKGKPTPTAQDLIAHRGGKEIVIDGADPFFESLERLVSIQTELQRRNPRSTELLVASTKKYLGETEHRVQLNELVGQELRQLATQLGASEFGVPNSFAETSLLNRISRYEAAVEPLMRVFGLLGRWGIGLEFELATSAIKQFSIPSMTNGYTIYIAMQRYPGMLLMYAYGLGLLKAGRYKELFKLFSVNVPNSHNKGVPIVTRSFLGAWESMDHRLWQKLPGLDGRRTALSDHLEEIFRDSTVDYIYIPPEFTSLFEEFETIGALAFLTFSTDVNGLKEAQKGDDFGRNFVWCPIGRFAWDSNVRDGILEKWRNPEYAKPILNAGFAGGDQAFFDLALENICRICGRFEWM